jgi:hypothetical protein
MREKTLQLLSSVRCIILQASGNAGDAVPKMPVRILNVACVVFSALNYLTAGSVRSVAITILKNAPSVLIVLRRSCYKRRENL